MRQLWPQPQANENRAQFSCATASREPIGPFPGFSGEISPRFGIPSSGVHNGRNRLGRPFSFKFLIFPFSDIRNAHNGRHHVLSPKNETSCGHILFPSGIKFWQLFCSSAQLQQSAHRRSTHILRLPPQSRFLGRGCRHP